MPFATRCSSPPPPIHAEPTDLKHDHPNDIAWEPVSYAEVWRAIFALNQHKAPGPSQITYMALQWAWAANPLPIYLLISWCANVGYHPQIWRKTVAVALRKPKKPDYSNPRAYCLIQLEECLGKVLESIIARRLSHMIHTHNLVPTVCLSEGSGRKQTNNQHQMTTVVSGGLPLRFWYQTSSRCIVHAFG